MSILGRPPLRQGGGQGWLPLAPPQTQARGLYKLRVHMEPHPNLRGKSEENQKDQPGWCEQLEEARRARPNRGEVKTTGIGCGRTLPKNTGLHSLGGGLAQSLSATLLPPRFCYYIRLRRGPDVCHATNWSTQGGWSFAELSPGHPGCSPYCKEKPPAPPPSGLPIATQGACCSLPARRFDLLQT